MPFNRFCAAEIEVATMRTSRKRLIACRNKWDFGIVTDGSLRNAGHAHGFEINTAPAAGNRFVDQVKDVCDVLKAGKASTTEICGLHIHVNAKDFDHDDIARLVDVYKRVEAATMLMQPRARRGSVYCTPCGQAYDQARASREGFELALDRAVYQTDNARQIANDKGRKYGTNQEVRRRAMNLHSWFYRGTVEFRLHTGTTNFDKITSWAAICVAILELAKSKDQQAINNLKFATETDSIVSLIKIAPTLPAKRYILSRIRTWNTLSKAMEAFNKLPTKLRVQSGTDWQKSAPKRIKETS
jgi:hypothetical protein